ncbi:MAG: ribonuclease D [Proteobacteria bacterium]|nr:ribonuclease D [Pseudomonadota bacterium]
MKIITKTTDLAAFCAECAKHDYVTVDTEFLRERTYYSKLCLIQMAYPGQGDENAVLIDPLSDDLSLAPLYTLFTDESVVKVFHAARQDLEIFFIDEGIIPNPLFDTQVAAMVCGYGEQVGYETLVRKIANAPLDKSSRFTDWSTRPLSDRQKTYALGDVTHLRDIYEHLKRSLEKNSRHLWVQEELGILTNPATYTVHPDDAWKRVKTRNGSGKMLVYVQELARFREIHAQTKNIPRNRVYKDDALLELAATKPTSVDQLRKSRLLLRDARGGVIADGIIGAVRTASKVEPKDFPVALPVRVKKQGNDGLSDLLRVLLKASAEKAGVASKLICNASDLDAIASGERSLAVFSGWRNEVFGADALKLCDGKIALSANKDSVKIVNV